MKRRQILLTPLAAAIARAQAPSPARPDSPRPDSPLLRAMLDELERSRQLRVVSKDPLYFLEYTLDDADFYSVTATLGSLLREGRTRLRVPRVYARAGSPEFDNTNYTGTDFYFGSRYDPEQLPLDDDYNAIRHALWLATDRAFKTAIDALGRKRAALRNVTQAEKLPDFSAAPAPVKKDVIPARIRFDEAAWKARAVGVSAELKAFPEVFDSEVELQAVSSISYQANSEGTVAVTPEPIFSVRIRASAQAPDGMPIRQHLFAHALDPAKLPAELDLRRMARSAGEGIRALAKAPAGEAYTGPVLFEGTAGAQLFAELLSTSLPATRRPVSEPNRPLNYNPGAFDGRIGSRVLPQAFTVVDDPTQREWRGLPLLGHYEVDSEGVIPAPLTVVEKGVLKTLLSTRQPCKDAPATNGRARLPGAFGARMPAISNLFVQTSEGSQAADLRSQLTKLASDRSKAYGLIVRRMDFPSTASFAELRRIAQGQERPVSAPLMIYRLYPDGREELVRGMRFRSLSARSLREILSASADLFPFDFLGNYAPFSLVGGGGYVFPSTVVAPSVLFEELELEPISQDLPKLPLAPPPAASR